MRPNLKLIILLLLPASLLGQSTVNLKKQAGIVAQAFAAGNYITVVNYMYPKAIQLAGGKKQLVQIMNTAMTQMQAQGISIQNVAIGEPGKFYKAGTELHCLVPQNIRLKTANGSFVNHTNLLAISADGGNNWKFLTLNKRTISSLPKLFPNFNKELIIPEPTMPGW